MKKILFLLLLLPFFAHSQGTGLYGRVGVNMGNTWAGNGTDKFDVTGPIRFRNYASGVLSVDANGRLLVTTGGAVPTPGASGTVLTSNGTVSSWNLILNANVSTSAAIAITKLAAGTANTVLTTNGTTNSFVSITDAFISSSAAIAVSKLAAGSANTLLTSNGTTNSFIQLTNAYIASGAAISALKLIDGSITDTELGYINTLTSNAQTQINAKFTLPALTLGSLIFSNGSTLTQDNTNFFVDNTAKAMGIGTNAPNGTSVLDLTSTTKGFLMPRMTQAQRLAISTPAAGLQVYQTDNVIGAWIYQSGAWTRSFTNTTGTLTPFDITATNDQIFFGNSLTGYQSIDLTWSDANKNLNVNGRGAFVTGATFGATTTPAPDATNGGIDIFSGGLSVVIGADAGLSTRTNNTTKVGRLGNTHFVKGEEPLAILMASSTSTGGFVYIGGSTIMNAPTSVRVHTAANNTTLFGTERARFDSLGNFVIGTTIALAPLHVYKSTTTATTIATFETSGTGGRPNFNFRAENANYGTIGYTSTGNDNMAIINARNGTMFFSTNGNTSINIAANGNIATGAFTPNSKLDVNGDITLSGGNSNNIVLKASTDLVSTMRWDISGLTTAASNFQVGRLTSGGNLSFSILKGDNSSNIQTNFTGFSNSYINALAGGVAIGGTTPNSSAKLDVISTTQGVRFSPMTAAQRVAISTPAAGLLAYQTDGIENYYVNTSGGWKSLEKSALSTVSKTANYTVTLADYTIRGNATSGNITFTLPTAASAYNSNTLEGKTYTFKRTDASGNTLTIAANGAELIDGTNTKTINTQYNSITVQSNGTSWDIL